MHAIKTILAIATLAGYAAAQSAWTVDKSCSAAFIVETCIKDRDPQIKACEGNDYECLCNQYTALEACYNNCPNDPSVSPVHGTVVSYCGAYSASLPATTSTIASSSASTGSSLSPSSTSTSGPSNPSNDEESSSTSTSADATSTGDTGAGFAVAPTRSYGALAGLLAVAGAFL